MIGTDQWMTGEDRGPIAMRGNRFLRSEARKAKKWKWIPMLNKAIWAVPWGRHVVPRGVQDKIGLTKKKIRDSGFVMTDSVRDTFCAVLGISQYT